MDASSIEELFFPFAPVRVKRMFGGHGIYAVGHFFALESAGEIFLKTDAGTEPAFAAAGSHPFSYDRAGKTATMAYWRMPEAAFDDSDELKRWCNLALDAALRALVRKSSRRRLAKPSRRAMGGSSARQI
jgi:DNA transformation protein